MPTSPTSPPCPTSPTRPASFIPLRRALVYTHRWLGIAGSLLFFTWCLSGIVMMYARMPQLTPEDRLKHLAPLDLSGARVDPGEVIKKLPEQAERLRISMLDGRVVYRIHDGARWTAVFADSGERLTSSPDAALAAVRAFAPDDADTARYDTRLEEPDQWTLQIRGLLPVHRIALGDRLDTYVYVSEQTAEPVLQTTRSSRLWGYMGAVFHWIYFTPIRRNGAVWTQLIIWTSLAGSVLSLTGLVWGIWRYSVSSRYRLRGVPHAHSPYAGLMRWHHYTGLAVGFVTFTWVFSGLLSMNPWDWSPDTSPSRRQREAVSGGPPAFHTVTLPALREAAAALGAQFTVREIEVSQFRGELVAVAYHAPDPAQPAPVRLGDPGDIYSPRIALDRRLASLSVPGRAAFAAFDRRDVEDAARLAMPGATVADFEWMATYDAYYYDRAGRLPLPVLRARFRDDVGTWLYLDPGRGLILRREQRLNRLNRWLYHGLHSLDFPWLYDRRPLWDIVVIGLSVGCLALIVTSAPTGWRRLLRHARRGWTQIRSGRGWTQT